MTAQNAVRQKQAIHQRHSVLRDASGTDLKVHWKMEKADENMGG